MSLVGKTYLPVVIDTPPARAMIACKPYRAKLSFEACAKRSKLATAHRAGNMAPDSPLAVSACRDCSVGLNTRQVMRAHGLKVPTRRVRQPIL